MNTLFLAISFITELLLQGFTFKSYPIFLYAYAWALCHSPSRYYIVASMAGMGSFLLCILAGISTLESLLLIGFLTGLTSLMHAFLHVSLYAKTLVAWLLVLCTQGCLFGLYGLCTPLWMHGAILCILFYITHKVIVNNAYGR